MMMIAITHPFFLNGHVHLQLCVCVCVCVCVCKYVPPVLVPVIHDKMALCRDTVSHLM